MASAWLGKNIWITKWPSGSWLIIIFTWTRKLLDILSLHRLDITVISPGHPTACPKSRSPTLYWICHHNPSKRSQFRALLSLDVLQAFNLLYYLNSSHENASQTKISTSRAHGPPWFQWCPVASAHGALLPRCNVAWVHPWRSNNLAWRKQRALFFKPNSCHLRFHFCNIDGSANMTLV